MDFNPNRPNPTRQEQIPQPSELSFRELPMRRRLLARVTKQSSTSLSSSDNAETTRRNVSWSMPSDLNWAITPSMPKDLVIAANEVRSMTGMPRLRVSWAGSKAEMASMARVRCSMMSRADLSCWPRERATCRRRSCLHLALAPQANLANRALSSAMRPPTCRA